jgi:hypothetical protein
MTTEMFLTSDFEKALPKHRQTGKPLWVYAGFIDGERVYDVPVKDGLVVRIKSSIGYAGISDDCGENSIRIWVVDSTTGNALIKKEDAWTTRVKGWQTRMLDKIRKQYAKAQALRRCPKCGSWLTPRTGKYGDFLGCTNFPNCKYTQNIKASKPVQLELPKAPKPVVRDGVAEDLYWSNRFAEREMEQERRAFMSGM